MKTQCLNPYLPLYEHIPDGEPHVFHNRLYIFGSHDLENGNEFCELDYVAWSAPVDDLSDWQFENVIYRKNQDPYNADALPLYAPDVVQGKDGRFYLYYCIKFQDSIHVAVCDTPAGKYEFYGRVHYPDGSLMSDNQPYDPSVICSEEGIFLYFGFAPCQINIPRYKGQDLKGGSVVELQDDMLTVKSSPAVVIPSLNYGRGTSFEGNEYFEAPSIRKINGIYYLIYSSINTHQLCYAISDKPMEGFVYGGVIVSNGDVGYMGRTESDKLMSVGNNHGGLVEVCGQWYIFYHRHTSLNQYNRQGCAERISFDANGRIAQVTITTSGMNKKPLAGDASYPAVYCCNLTNGHMGALSSLGRTNAEVDFPYITCMDGERFVANIKNGDMIGYKYINLMETKKVEVVYRASGNGILEIHTSPDSDARAQIALTASSWWKAAETKVEFTAKEQELYLIYTGEGVFSLLTLNLKGQQ
ncbi:MAG: family 43 glycosylhydrolase [Lachnospiraceae bacterium]|nr:family 43 glycosylhydrolase [Lachnospiraceae bacterium]